MKQIKSLAATAFVLSLLSGASALAQPPESGAHPREGEKHEGQSVPPRNAPAAQSAPHAPPPAAAGARPGGPDYRGAEHGAPGSYNGAPAQSYRGAPAPGYSGGQAQAYRANAAEAQRGGGAAIAHGVPNSYHPHGGVPGFRPGGDRPHYDPQFFPREFRPDHAFAWRGAVWRSQPGFYYRHWGYGDRLPFGWFDRHWYIADYYYYDLPVPPYGYEWIRVGPDALLVDLDDGTVVEAVYGLFY